MAYGCSQRAAARKAAYDRSLAARKAAKKIEPDKVESTESISAKAARLLNVAKIKNGFANNYTIIKDFVYKYGENVPANYSSAVAIQWLVKIRDAYRE